MMAWICAVWVLLHFTAPDSGAFANIRYELERGSMLDGWQAAHLYRTPNPADSIVVPASPGSPESIWVSVTLTPGNPYGSARGGQAFRLRAANWDTVGAWSNYTLVAAAARDTLYTDGRSWRYPATGMLRFTWAPADTALDTYGLGLGPILTYETAMQALKPIICGMYGYWVLRGVRQDCLQVNDLRVK